MTSSTTHGDNQPPNLISRLWDEEYFLERVRKEEASGCDIGAGPQSEALGRLLTEPESFKQGARLQHLLLKQLKRRLAECQLGSGMDAAFTVGEAILQERLATPTAAQLQALAEILELDVAAAQEQLPTKLNQMLNETLQPEGWEAIAAAAAEQVRQQILQQCASAQ